MPGMLISYLMLPAVRWIPVPSFSEPGVRSSTKPTSETRVRLFHWHRTVLPAWRPALRRKTYQLAPSRCKCAPPSPMHRVSVLACRCERGAGGCGHSIAPCSRAMHLITVVSAGFRVRRELVRGLFSNETTPLGKLRVGPCFAWRFGPPRPPSMTGSAKYGCATSSLGCLSRTGTAGPQEKGDTASQSLCQVVVRPPRAAPCCASLRMHLCLL